MQDGSTYTSDDPKSAQLFEFSPNDTKQRLLICVPVLVQLHQKSPASWETIRVPITNDDTKLLIATRGIDPDHVATIEVNRAFQEGYAIFMDNGSFLVVDGNHRYVWRSLAGLKWMDFHTCRSPEWHPALVNVEATRRLMKGRKA